MYPKSEELFSEAEKHLVGGVNSPVRAFKSVGGNPLIIKKAKGAYIYDADDNAYIDYVNSYGPHILGHTNEKINKAIIEALENGTCYGATSPAEIELAILVKEAFSYVDKVRFVNSGTEAAMSAIRLARAYTQRDKIIKFAGCYHGHSDFLLADAGSGVATLSLPGSAGVPQSTVDNTLIAEFNDIKSVENWFKKFPNQIAAVAIEPIPGNMGLVLPKPDFLQQLRDLCTQEGTVLLFDEVMSGFRNGFGGVDKHYGVEPDIVCLGKIIGGGMPVGAYAGKAEVMDWVAPLGTVYQAGTLSGNPVAMKAGIAMLTQLKNKDVYRHLEEYTQTLCTEIEKLAKKHNISLQVQRYGSMFTPFLNNEPVHNYQQAKKSDTLKFAKFFWELTRNGIYLPPSQFEAWFVSSACTDSELSLTIEAFDNALRLI